MRPLLQLKTMKGLSLRDIDAAADAAARGGFGGFVLPRDGGWELTRGFCRSSGKRGLRVWLRDDPLSPSGSFGGEVASVPAYRSELPGLWGCRLYSSDAAEAFLDCSYTDMRRELKGFMGYELAGAVTSVGLGALPERPEDFAETQLRPLAEFCGKQGIELAVEGAVVSGAEKYAGARLGVLSSEGLTMAERQKALFGLMADGIDLPAVTDEAYPDFMEAAWCAGAETLTAAGKPAPAEIEPAEGLRALKAGRSLIIYNVSGKPAEAELDMEALGVRYIAGLNGGLYLPLGGRLRLTVLDGGCVVMTAGSGAGAEPMPTFLDSGAVVGEYEVETRLVPSLAGLDENRLPLEPKDGCAEFELQNIDRDSGLRIEAENAGYIRLNGRELAGTNIGAPSGPVVVGSGELRLGINTVETDGTGLTLYGSFNTDGKAVAAPASPGPGDVRTQGLARYDGPLVYRAALPEDCGGKYLVLDGCFGCAAVKIGRRRQPLPLPPFAAPLFSSDGGKTAEIIVFPANDRQDVPFGLDAVNIVHVKK